MKFKWSHFKRDVSNKIVDIVSLNRGKKQEEPSGKVLIVSLDALGDSIIKSKTLEILETYFGKENTYILCKDKWKDFFQKMGFNIFVEEYKSTVKKALLYRKLNRMNFDKIIYFRHDLNEKNRYFFPENKIIEQDLDRKYNYILN